MDTTVKTAYAEVESRYSLTLLHSLAWSIVGSNHILFLKDCCAVQSGSSCLIWKFYSLIRCAKEWERPWDRLPYKSWEGRIMWAVLLVWKLEENTGWVESVWSTDFPAIHQSELTRSIHYVFRCWSYADTGFAGSCTPWLWCNSKWGRGCSKRAALQAPSALQLLPSAAESSASMVHCLVILLRPKV